MQTFLFLTYIVLGDAMECLRCGNTEDKYFYLDNDVYYCRKCILFGRIDVGSEGVKKVYRKKKYNCQFTLDYSLTPYQKKAVAQLNAFLENKEDVLVYAATGAGKTEIVMQCIQNYLNAGKKVGIAISRRQVVLEIAKRMQEAFRTLKVVAVCEGYTRVVDGDLIVCTMHQLYRYPHCFDLLIMDEVDAFPYFQNALLERIAMHSCIGEKVYLSATPDEIMKQQIKEQKLAVVELFVRPHYHALVIPKVKVRFKSLQIVELFLFMRKKQRENKQVLIFVPTIVLSVLLKKVFHFLFAVESFSSKTIDKEAILENFRAQKIQFLFCTTVLERGITIKGVDVCVLQADHIVFSEASLIQIFGRVGRSMQIPTGEALLLCTWKNKAIKDCVRNLEKMNTSLKNIRNK